MKLFYLFFCSILIVLLLIGGCWQERPSVKFYGGLKGATALRFAEGIATILNEADFEVLVVPESSGGAKTNLFEVDKGGDVMGVVYAGDAYLGRMGLLREGVKLENVVALARLYGPAAQLAVHQRSNIKTPFDLKKHLVVIGAHGSASAVAAKRFFSSLGIWEDIFPVYAGPTRYMEEFYQFDVHALWLLTGIPASSFLEIDYRTPIRLLDLFEVARSSGHFESYPFYHFVTIPAGTYKGQKHDVFTYQDAAIWVANKQLGEKIVQRGLELLFSDEGLAKMRTIHPAAKDLDKEKGLYGVLIPLHRGALSYWGGEIVPAE